MNFKYIAEFSTIEELKVLIEDLQKYITLVDHRVYEIEVKFKCYKET